MVDESDEGDRPSDADRRASARHLACFPAEVEIRAGDTRTAFIRDLSATGARLLTLKKIEPGAPVKLSLHLEGYPADAPRIVTGVVVRDERREPGLAFPWTHNIGVKFDEPAPDLTPIAEALSKEQDKTFGPRR